MNWIIALLTLSNLSLPLSAEIPSTDTRDVMFRLNHFLNSLREDPNRGNIEGQTPEGTLCWIVQHGSRSGDEGENLHSAGLSIFDPMISRTLGSFTSFDREIQSEVLEAQFTQSSAYIFQKEDSDPYDHFPSRRHKKLMIEKDDSGDGFVSIATRSLLGWKWSEVSCHFQQK